MKDQTYELCKLAVQQNGYALQFVKEQTEDICKLAVKQNGYASYYMKEQTDELCKLAIQQNKEAIKYIVINISYPLRIWLCDHHIYDRVDVMDKIIYDRLYDRCFCISV